MKILFIGARLYHDLYFYIQEKKIYSIITESNERSDNLNLANEYHIVNRGMKEPCEIAIKENVNGVVPLIGIDPPLLGVSLMKEVLEDKYNIPVISSNKTATKIAINKFLTKEFFKYIGINTPNYFIYQNKNLIFKNTMNLDLDNEDKNLKSFLKYLDNLEIEIYDCDNLSKNFKINSYYVLKQLEGQGAKDLVIVNDVDGFFEYVNRFNLTLAEEYIDGYELSIEVLSYKGEYIPLVPVYKGETTLDGIHPLNKVRSAPCNIHGLNNDLVKNIAVKIVKDLNLEGTIDIDFIFSKKDKKLYTTEINPRVSGTRYLTLASTSINPLLKLVDMVLGDFNFKDINNEIKNYHSLEFPAHNFNNFKIQNFNENFHKNSWFVHGPKNHERITVSSESEEGLYEITEKLVKLTNLDIINNNLKIK
jgi:carbamoylphosphate synthase large subunit